jgi:hypothetical protein
LEAIEKQLPLLSPDELIRLIEQIARRLRNAHRPHRPDDFAAEMEAMANDPEIQAANRQIEAETAGMQ